MKKGVLLLRQIKKDLLRMLEEAPEFGSCGIVITLHKGRITRISSQKEETKIGEKI